MYNKCPPLDKLVAKIGLPAQEKTVQDLVAYVKTREAEGSIGAALPDLHALGQWVSKSYAQLPEDVKFAFIDLVRIAAADPRVSGYLAAEEGKRTLLSLLSLTADYSSLSYSVQAVTLQLVCNLFGSNVFQENIIDPSSNLRALVEKIASGCMLAKHNNARSLAAAVVYNLAAIDHNERLDGRADRLGISQMSDLEAALVEAVVNENESKETLHSLLLALGLLLYAAPSESSAWDLCSAMEVRASLKDKSKSKLLAGEPLLKEIGEELLAKGGPA